MINLPVALIAAFSAMLIGQTWKVVRPIFRGSPPVLKNFLQSGGFPSSHTAATASMAVTIALREGFSSSLFALAAVLTGLVAHDAVKVRGTINSLVNILRRLDPGEETAKLPDTVGHTVGEVIAGFVLSGAVGALCHWILP
ncbi:MAG: divergent PAP2 family protein [Spirochaetales bacterium]|nr:divergent PAP2 family protein [Spirochaetales bacterium]